MVVAIARLAAALLILNASLTFQSLWPTPAVRWTGELSIELAAGLLIAIAATLVGASPTSRRAIRWMAIVWLVFVIGRYGDVIAQALYGRDINLYWDLRFIPDVASMLARAMPWWLIAAAVAGTVLVIALLYVVIRWAIARVVDAIQAPAARGVLAAAAIAIVALFAVEYPQNLDAHERWFPTPITTQYFRQARLTVDALRGGRSVPASPPMNSDFSRVQGADVILLFIESYGAVTFDRPDFAAPLEDARRTLDDAIHATGRNSVSAFVESPTFGGESWLAHISLMSGVEVRDPHTNAVLMTQHRETVVNAFSRHGYRTIANMPGLWWDWPEGSFYGFEDIYGALRLDYRGPQFGWFTLTDQFALARSTRSRSRSSHGRRCSSSFRRSARMRRSRRRRPISRTGDGCSTSALYHPADLDRSFEQVADWLDLGPGYVKAVDYSLRTSPVTCSCVRTAISCDRDRRPPTRGSRLRRTRALGRAGPLIASRPELLERFAPAASLTA